jgi:hypothetical protein
MSMTFEPALTADVLINLLAAAGLVIVARANQRIDPRGAMTRRIVFALSLVAALFSFRATGWMMGSGALRLISSVLAGATPLAGLFVVEGLLRRHAPPIAKTVFVGGFAIVALMTPLDFLAERLTGLVMLIVVFGGFGSLAWLLLFRDRNALTGAENRTIRRLLGAVAFMLPLILTDFRSVFWFFPVRLGALGVLIVLYVSFSASGLSAPGRTRVLCLFGFLAIAAAFAIGFGLTQQQENGILLFTIGAVGFSGLILAALLSEEIGARTERARPPSPLLGAEDRQAFEAALKADPLLRDAKILAAAELADVAGPQLDALLARRGVLRRQDAPWGLAADDGGVERALSLLTTYDATHLLRLSRAPLKLAALALPAIANDPRAETEIALAQRFGEMLYAKGAN